MAPLVTASVIYRILGNDGSAGRRAGGPAIDRHELAKDASELLGLTVEARQPTRNVEIAARQHVSQR
jgi:hypothetical protein